MAFQIKKHLSIFSAAHRLVQGYQGKCKDLHGHNYAIEVGLSTDTLDQYGFVMDFSDIKRLLDNWVQNHWDHATLVCQDDMPLREFVETHQQTHYLLPTNTTAESLAKHAFDIFDALLKNHHGNNVKLTEVTVWESPNACATYHAH